MSHSLYYLCIRFALVQVEVLFELKQSIGKKYSVNCNVRGISYFMMWSGPITLTGGNIE